MRTSTVVWEIKQTIPNTSYVRGKRSIIIDAERDLRLLEEERQIQG